MLHASARYNPVWEFCYSIGGQPCDMAFTSVAGHLMELEFPDAYRRWKGVDPVELYAAPLHKQVPQVFGEPPVALGPVAATELHAAQMVTSISDKGVFQRR